MKALDLTGKIFNRWTVLHRVEQPKILKRKCTYWACKCTCGTKKIIPTHHLTHSMSKSCGCLKLELAKQCCGVDSHGWKGGKFIDKDGYVKIYKPGHLPKASYVREHVLVMEILLGRRLFPSEQVHHKNGIRNDNRPENLELWSKSHPSGQRVSDKVKWAKEILLFYGELF